MSASRVQIVVNGTPRDIPKKMNVKELVAFLGFDQRTIAIGRNEEVLPKSKFKSTSIEPGDRIDVVHFVAGG